MTTTFNCHKGGDRVRVAGWRHCASGEVAEHGGLEAAGSVLGRGLESLSRQTRHWGQPPLGLARGCGGGGVWCVCTHMLTRVEARIGEVWDRS